MLSPEVGSFRRPKYGLVGYTDPSERAGIPRARNEKQDYCCPPIHERYLRTDMNTRQAIQKILSAAPAPYLRHKVGNLFWIFGAHDLLQLHPNPLKQ